MKTQRQIPHINAWRGTGDKSAAHLLCEIWRQEEVDMKVNRESSSAISGKVKLTVCWTLHQNRHFHNKNAIDKFACFFRHQKTTDGRFARKAGGYILTSKRPKPGYCGCVRKHES